MIKNTNYNRSSIQWPSHNSGRQQVRSYVRHSMETCKAEKQIHKHTVNYSRGCLSHAMKNLPWPPLGSFPFRSQPLHQSRISQDYTCDYFWMTLSLRIRLFQLGLKYLILTYYQVVFAIYCLHQTGNNCNRRCTVENLNYL